MPCSVELIASLGVIICSNASLAVSGQALTFASSTHALAGIAVSQVARGAKRAIGASGVGSARCTQIAVTVGVIAAVTAGATRVSIGTTVMRGVTTSVIGLLIMAETAVGRLMVDATVTTRVATVKGVMLGELIIHAIGALGVRIRRPTHKCYAAPSGRRARWCPSYGSGCASSSPRR